MKIRWYNTKLEPNTNFGIVHTIEKKNKFIFTVLTVPQYNKKKIASKSCM